MKLPPVGKPSHGMALANRHLHCHQLHIPTFEEIHPDNTRTDVPAQGVNIQQMQLVHAVRLVWLKTMIAPAPLVCIARTRFEQISTLHFLDSLTHHKAVAPGVSESGRLTSSHGPEQNL